CKPQLGIAGAESLPHEYPSASDLLLHVMACLPEKHVRSDGGPEDGDQSRDVILLETDRRNERRIEHSRPVRLNKECNRDVGQQGQREPLEDTRNEPVGAEYLQQNNYQCNWRDERGN